MTSRIARASLPSPQYFYCQRYGLELKGSGEWRSVKCPFHEDKHPSLRINLSHGGYWCPVCGAKGSMIDFEMQMSGLDYADAILELGGGR